MVQEDKVEWQLKGLTRCMYMHLPHLLPSSHLPTFPTTTLTSELQTPTNPPTKQPGSAPSSSRRRPTATRRPASSRCPAAIPSPASTASPAVAAALGPGLLCHGGITRRRIARLFRFVCEFCLFFFSFSQYLYLFFSFSPLFFRFLLPPPLTTVSRLIVCGIVLCCPSLPLFLLLPFFFSAIFLVPRSLLPRFLASLSSYSPLFCYPFPCLPSLASPLVQHSLPFAATNVCTFLIRESKV